MKVLWQHERMPVLSLGLLFGWILMFPMFGPWLALQAGTHTGIIGLAFLLGHTIAYGLCSFTARDFAPWRKYLTLGLAMGTAVFFTLPLGLLVALPLLFMLGLLSAPLVVHWTQWFARHNYPYFPLALSMVISNAMLAVSIAPGVPVVAVKVLIIVLPLVVTSIDLPILADVAGRGAPDSTNVNKSLWALGAFGVITYFVGGVWYRVYTVPSFPHTASLALLDLVCYMAGMALLSWWQSTRANLSLLAAFTISVMGLGLVLAQVSTGLTPRILISLSLAGADYYYWLALWALSRFLPARRVFACGLGFSLIQISLATILDMFNVLSLYPARLFFAVATGVTMLLLPLVMNSRFDLTASDRPREITIPSSLTEAEARVFALLVKGASDQDIADELFISRHTVKFHVRNILHKCDVPNRKVLLSRLTTPQDNS